MTFEEFWDDAGWHKDFKDDLEEVWNAAQQAEREKYQGLIAAAKAAVVSCWRLDTDITEEIAALRKLLEGLKEKGE